MTVPASSAIGGRLSGTRIAVVGIDFPPEPTGISPYTHELALAAQSAGATVDVITGVPHYPAWRTAPEYRRGIRWHEQVDGLTVKRRRHFVPRTASTVGRALMELTFAAHILPTLLRTKADAIVAVTPSLSAVLATALAKRGRPMGVVVQDLTGRAARQASTTGRQTAGLLERLEYRALRQADRIGVIADRLGSILEEHGVAPERILHVPNFTRVEVPDVTKAEARARLGWPNDETLVVHTGNMGRKQGLEVVVAAAQFPRAADLHFVLLGDGNQRRRLQALGAGVANLDFRPPLSALEYPYALVAADVLLLNESAGVLDMALPSKITSYVSAASPIVAAVDPEGITGQYVTEHRIGRLTVPGDPGALVAAVHNVLADPAGQQELLSACGRLREQLSPKAAADAYVSFLASLLP